jgi:hypothetical protein
VSSIAVDPIVARRLQSEVGQRLAAAARQARDAGRPPLSREDEREHARSVIAGVIAGEAARHLQAGQVSLTPDRELALAEAIFAGLFGAGRLQILLDDPTVENVDINGCDGSSSLTPAGSGCVSARSPPAMRS